MGQEWTPLEGPAKIFEHGQALFAQRADVGTDAGMALSAFEGAKAARDLDPRLHEAEVTFGLVVREGQFPRPEESQDGVVITLQAIERAHGI